MKLVKHNLNISLSDDGIESSDFPFLKGRLEIPSGVLFSEFSEPYLYGYLFSDRRRGRNKNKIGRFCYVKKDPNGELKAKEFSYESESRFSKIDHCMVSKKINEIAILQNRQKAIDCLINSMESMESMESIAKSIDSIAHLNFSNFLNCFNGYDVIQTIERISNVSILDTFEIDASRHTQLKYAVQILPCQNREIVFNAICGKVELIPFPNIQYKYSQFRFFISFNEANEILIRKQFNKFVYG